MRFCVRFAVLCFAALSLAHAQAPQLPFQKQKAPVAPIPVPKPNPATPAELTPQDVTAFLDGFLPLQMQRDDVAGATISIAQDGQILLQKGYGYADWKKKTPVDPVKTTFRLASISKLFAYTAMMQQVELGRLNLDADIQQYLDFPIKPGGAGIGSASITLRHLATHSAGFEEVIHDIGSDKSGKLPVGLRDMLIRDQPHRFAAPGKALAYSNYGISLIGYIVQRVSGEEYTSYIQRHIFTPLGMTHSSFVQPLPAGYERSLGYKVTSKDDTGFESFFTPAGGLSSSAADMNLFGQMLLGQGTYNGVTILQPSSVQTLLTPQVVPSPYTNPWDLGFYSWRRNGLTFTGHGGDLIAFHSEFWIESTRKLVFLISYNSANSAGDAREELFRAFVDRYLPGAPAPHPAYVKMTREELTPYTGFYLSSRRNDSTKTRFFLGSDPREVLATKDGELTISTAKDFRKQLLKFHPIGNDNFYEETSQNALHFERDASGNISGIASPGHADRAPFYIRPAVLYSLIVFMLGTALCVAIAPLVRLFRRIFLRRRERLAPQPGTRWVTFAMQMACVGILAVVAQSLIMIAGAADITNFYQVGHLDRSFIVQNVLTVLAFVLIVFGWISAAFAVRKPLRIITRVKFALVSLAGVAFVWFALTFHFIGNAHVY